MKEEHVLGEREAEIFALGWPDTLTPDNPTFQRRMYEVQGRLLRSKLPGMHILDRRRALASIAQLQDLMREEVMSP